MLPMDEDNIDQLIEAFSSDELINLSEDLFNIAIELTLQDDLDLSLTDSITKSNDLLAVIPKIIASRLSKADLYSRKFLSLDTEDLVFAGYSLEELRAIRKLLEDVVSFIEKRALTNFATVYRDVFEELKDSIDLSVERYQAALEKVNEAYKIHSRHVMNQAIDVYKRVNATTFEHLLLEPLFTLEEHQRHLSNAIELLESSDLGETYEAQLRGLRQTLILVLEVINTQTIGAGFPHKRFSYLDAILYHIRDDPDTYIFRVLRRFAHIGKDGTLLRRMSPEEIAMRHKTGYIKHNRALLSLISNPVNVAQDALLELTNQVLQHLSGALNIKLRFVRIQKLCQQVAEMPLAAHAPEQLEAFCAQILDALRILEAYPVNSDFLERLQGQGYQTAQMLLEAMRQGRSVTMANLLRQYQLYAARRLFALRISRLCMYIAVHSPRQLALAASDRVLAVCRELIQYKYDTLRPSSLYLDAMFDEDHYKDPVLVKIDTARQRDFSEDAGKAELPEELAALRPSFSQLVIDCLALKVQELDRVIEPLRPDMGISETELSAQIDSLRERIAYFLKQHREEDQLTLTTYEQEHEYFIPV